MKTLLRFLVRNRETLQLGFTRSGPEASSFPRRRRAGLSRCRQQSAWPGRASPTRRLPEPTCSHRFCVAAHGRRRVPALTGVQYQAPGTAHVPRDRQVSDTGLAGPNHPPGAWPSPQSRSKGPGALCGLHGWPAWHGRPPTLNCE